MACVESSLQNRINELHNDILVQILSLLTLKEAGQTSILSKRWRDIWSYVPILNFDSKKFLDRNFFLPKNKKALEEEEPKYFSWVDQVMTSHKGSTIDEFRVQFNLHPNRKDNVDNWVRSAIEKRVKRFQLDLGPVLSYSWEGDYLFYTFPSLSVNSLTSLHLSRVDVSGEILEKLLHDCPLEHLSVSESDILKKLKVVGPSLKLKSLSLMFVTWPVDALEISAPNLTSFGYGGSILGFPFKSIPKLTNFFIRGEYAKHLMYDFSSLSSHASQIEVLTLETLYYPTENIRTAETFPVCSRLKLLNVTIVPKFDYQLFGLLSLIKACPLLHKFVMQFNDGGCPEVKRTSEMRNIEACSYPCLKIVEIIGFVGWELDYGFVECLIENAVSLEKILIQPTDSETSDEPCVEESVRRAMQRAEQLRSNLNPGTELKILNPEVDEIYDPFNVPAGSWLFPY